MRILTNELNSAKLLRRAGFSVKKSDAIMSMLFSSEIYNLYSKEEIDIMLSETVEKVFAENRFMLNEQRREFDAKMVVINKQIDKNYDDLKSSRRWVIGTIITVGMGLAAYLSALFQISH